MQPWDSVIINADSNDPNKGRAGLVQSVTKDGNGVVQTAVVRLDADAKNDIKVVTCDAANLTALR